MRLPRVLAGFLAVAALALACMAIGCQPTAKTSPNQAAQAPVDAKTKPAAAEPADDRPQPPEPLVGWDKPAVALVITGQQLGYIEPCGCTGLENQKGGLARRHTLIKQLAEEKRWPVVPLDVGSQVRRFGRQSEIKLEKTAEGLRTMGYRAVMLGFDDLRLPINSLLTATNPPDEPNIFTAANIVLASPEYLPPFQVIEAGGKKIGVAGVLGDSFVEKLQGDELVRQPAVEGLKQSCRQLEAENCDYNVLLAHATPEEAATIAAEVPIFDLVVCSGGGGLHSAELERIEGTEAQILRISHKAMHVAVVGLFEKEGKLTPRYESVPLDARLADSPDMLKLLADYQEQLKSEGFDGLGLKPQPHPSGKRFVGSETCGECHTKAFEIWSGTPHAHAMDSLVHPPNSRGDIPRHFDPECLSCHVTGWEPQKFYPFASGYTSLEKTPALQHNGCENCHGPGSAHVAAENDSDEAAKMKLREAMKLPIAGGIAEAKCRECHDEDNSPDFSHKGFAAYWKEVEHRGKD